MRPLRVEISSVQYTNGAYDAIVTTRPGASFALASAAPGAGYVPADKNAPCTATPTGVTGILTSYSVHCPGAHIASPLLEVRTASGSAGAKAVVPLAVGTNR